MVSKKSLLIFFTYIKNCALFLSCYSVCLRMYLISFWGCSKCKRYYCVVLIWCNNGIVLWGLIKELIYWLKYFIVVILISLVRRNVTTSSNHTVIATHWKSSEYKFQFSWFNVFFQGGRPCNINFTVFPNPLLSVLLWTVSHVQLAG